MRTITFVIFTFITIQLQTIAQGPGHLISAKSWQNTDHSLQGWKSNDLQYLSFKGFDIPLPLHQPVWSAEKQLNNGEDYDFLVTQSPLKENGYPALDSILSYNQNHELFEKIINHYDENGRLVLVETFNMNVLPVDMFHIPSQYSEYEYDEFGNQTRSSTYIYDVDDHFTDDHYLQMLLENIYDEENRLISNSLFFYEAGTNQLISPSQRITIEYDPVHGLQQRYLAERYIESDWRNSLLQENSYFENGFRKTHIFLQANTEGNWIWGQFLEYEPYIDSLMTGFIYKEWSTQTQDWEISYKFEYDYHENNLPATGIYFHWDEGEEEWWTFRNDAFEYDESDELVKMISQSRDTSDDDFKNDFKEIFYNDENINIVERHTWSDEAELWQKESKRSREFNDMNNLIYDGELLWSEEFDKWYYNYQLIIELDPEERMILNQRKRLQNPETMEWGGGNINIRNYDENGFLTLTANGSFNTSLQDFTFPWSMTYENDLYGNTKEINRYSGFLEQIIRVSIGYVGYNLELQVISQSIPLEGAILSIGDQSWVSDANGIINTTLVSGNDMNFTYTLSKEGFMDKTDNIIIDRNHSLTIALTPVDVQLYNVTFSVKMLDEVIENAEISLAGYGEQFTNNDGLVMFTDIAPQENIPFSLKYDETHLEGEVSVVDQDILHEINLGTVSITEQHTLAEKLNFFPNPAHEFVQINMGSDQPWQIELFDFQGRRVLIHSFYGNEFVQNVSYLESGVYLLRITSVNRVKAGRLIVK